MRVRLACVVAAVLLGLAAPGVAGAAAPNCGGGDLVVTPEGVVTSILTTGCTTLTIPQTVGSSPAVTITEIGTTAFSSANNGGLLTSVDASAATGLLVVGTSAFSGLANLTAVTLPNSVTTFRNNAFYNTPLLESVTAPSSLTTIGNRVFSLSGIRSFAMPNSVTSVGIEAFFMARSLTTLTLSTALVTTPAGLCEECTALTGTLVIPDSVTSVGSRSFLRTGLTGLTIGSRVTTIGDSAFAVDRSAGQRMQGTLQIPASVTDIGAWAFDQQGFTALTMHEGLRTIGMASFRLRSLTGGLTLPSTVTTSGVGAFEDTRLTSITLGSNVTTIGENAFAANRELSGVLRIPASVTGFGASVLAASGGTGLAVTFLGDRPSTLSGDAFDGFSGSLSFTTGTAGWGDAGRCGDTVALSGGTLTGVCIPTPGSASPSLIPAAGGPITLSGTGFMAGAIVRIGGQAATDVTVVSETTITATAPAGSGAPVVEVVNRGVRTGSKGDVVLYAASTAVPTAVRATPGDRSAAVRWAAPVAGVTVTYTVTAAPGGKTCTTTKTTCVVRGLANRTAYTFTVTAGSGFATSAASTASRTTTPRTTPGRVRALRLTRVAERVTATWRAPASDG
ncbi:MAG: leucine-rich repeat protein, partial [Actinomycetota bacterium]